MKKIQMCVIIALIAFVSTALAEQTWVEFTKGMRGAEPVLTVLESGFSGTTINLKTHGMWVEDVKEGKETYQRITLAASYTGEVGKPMLPVIRKLVAIPATAGVEVKVKSEKEKVYTNYLVYPAQEPKMENEPEPPFEKDEGFYDSDTLYPVKLSEVGAPAIMNDVRLVELVIQPFRYNAKTKELTVATDLTVYLDYSGVDDRNQLKRKIIYFDPQWERLYRSLVLNFGDIYNRIRTSDVVLPVFHYPLYLIIYAHDFRPEVCPVLDTFISWKTHMGFYVDVINLDSIPGINGQPDDAEDLRDYIYDWWYNDGLIYPGPVSRSVLLVGDAPDCDPNYPTDDSLRFLPVKCADDGHVPTFAYGPNNYHACDYWYQLLAGDDFYSDIALGRWCVEDSADLSTYVNKTFAYERDPDPGWDCNSALFVADDQEEGDTDFAWEKDRVVPYLPGYYPPLLKQYGDEGGTNEGVKSAIQNNGGVGIVNYRGHGGPNYWFHWCDSNSQSFTLADVYSLDQSSFNGYPVVYNMCCYNAMLSEGVESMVEAWTRHANGGGVGALGFSGGVWLSFSTGMDKDIFNGHFNNTLLLNCGMAIKYAEAQVGVTSEDLLYRTFWIGDPELDVWRKHPDSAYITTGTSHPDYIVFYVLRSSDDAPVPGTKVCMRRDGGGYQQIKYTDAAGSVYFPNPTQQPGTYYVTATNQRGPICIRPAFTTIGGSMLKSEQNEPLVDFIDWQLKPVYPNPLRSCATISYSVAGKLSSKENQHVELSIFDVTGREVKVLASGTKTPGHYEIIWNGKDDKGLRCASGVYFIKMHSNEFNANRRVVLLR